MTKPLSRSRALAARTMFAALKALQDHGGSLPVSEVMSEVGRRVTFDAWESARYEATGAIRWQSIMSFFSIDFVKAGYIVKQRGTWFLTKEGEAAIGLGAETMLLRAADAYRAWKLAQGQPVGPDEGGDVEVEKLKLAAVELEEIERVAVEGLKKHIAGLNAYEFQDLVAALLRGMGYYTPFVAPRGRDGGVDILAYRDPLGTVSPRIKAQVKHRGQAATVQEMRELTGLLQKDGDVGIFVSTGGFTPDAAAAARSSHVHIELIDLDRFIVLWQEFYSKLTDEDKTRLPLRAVYFHDPVEQ